MGKSSGGEEPLPYIADDRIKLRCLNMRYFAEYCFAIRRPLPSWWTLCAMTSFIEETYSAETSSIVPIVLAIGEPLGIGLFSNGFFINSLESLPDNGTLP